MILYLFLKHFILTDMTTLVDQAIQKIEQIQKAVEQAAKQTIEALKVGQDINDKTV